MLTGYISHVAEDPQPYRVFLKRDGQLIRVEAAATKAEAAQALRLLLDGERAYEAELRWYD